MGEEVGLVVVTPQLVNLTPVRVLHEISDRFNAGERRFFLRCAAGMCHRGPFEWGPAISGSPSLSGAAILAGSGGQRRRMGGWRISAGPAVKMRAGRPRPWTVRPVSRTKPSAESTFRWKLRLSNSVPHTAS